MDTLAHLHRTFAANAWSQRACLASLTAIDAPPARAVAWMGHLVGTEWLWLGRLKGAAEPAVVWPTLSLAECPVQLDELADRWQAYLGGLTADRLDETIAYTNSLGEPWTGTVHDVLQHVLLHGAHHRGQIAAELRAAGHAPAYTDFIHGIRSGLVDG